MVGTSTLPFVPRTLFSTFGMRRSVDLPNLPQEESRCIHQCPIILRTFSYIVRITSPCLLLVGVILMAFDFFNNRSEGRSFAGDGKTLGTLAIFDYGALTIIVGGFLLMVMIIARTVANYITSEETTTITEIT